MAGPGAMQNISIRENLLIVQKCYNYKKIIINLYNFIHNILNYKINFIIKYSKINFVIIKKLHKNKLIN